MSFRTKPKDPKLEALKANYAAEKKYLSPNQQWAKAERDWAKENRRPGKSRSGARGGYHKGEWIPSTWQLNCLKYLENLEKEGKIKDLESQVDLEFTIYNEAQQPMKLKLNMDFVFFDNRINRPCRWDAKPPKRVHTKWGKKNPWKIHEAWLDRYEILKFCQPDFNYRILEKNNVTEGIDI